MAVIVITVMALGAGCALLTEKVSSGSAPVVAGVASTNDSVAVAWIDAARKVNADLPVTPYSPLVDAALGSLASLAAASGGWLVRHGQQKAVDKAKPSV